jgi:hypothetical protein
MRMARSAVLVEPTRRSSSATMTLVLRHPVASSSGRAGGRLRNGRAPLDADVPLPEFPHVVARGGGLVDELGPGTSTDSAGTQSA